MANIEANAKTTPSRRVPARGMLEVERSGFLTQFYHVLGVARRRLMTERRSVRSVRRKKSVGLEFSKVTRLGPRTSTPQLPIQLGIYGLEVDPQISIQDLRWFLAYTCRKEQRPYLLSFGSKGLEKRPREDKEPTTRPLEKK